MIPTSERDTDWSQKYRPQTLADCVLPERIKSPLLKMVEKGALENLLFYGPFGAGKTTTANAICFDTNADTFRVNGSLDNGIARLREDVESFGSSYSLERHRKVVLIDEADGLTRDYQDGLRGVMDRLSFNCSYIFTTNYVERIAPAIRSRTIPFDFTYSPEEAERLKMEFIVRVRDILKAENATCDGKHVAEIVATRFPDFRQTIKQVQMSAV